MVTRCHGAKENNTVQKSLSNAAKRVLKIYKSNLSVDFLFCSFTVFKYLSCTMLYSMNVFRNCPAQLYLLINHTIFIGTCSCYSNTHVMAFLQGINLFSQNGLVVL